MQMLDFLARLMAANTNHSLSGVGICLIILQITVGRRVGKDSGGGATCAKYLDIGLWEQT